LWGRDGEKGGSLFLTIGGRTLSSIKKKGASQLKKEFHGRVLQKGTSSRTGGLQEDLISIKEEEKRGVSIESKRCSAEKRVVARTRGPGRLRFRGHEFRLGKDARGGWSQV